MAAPTGLFFENKWANLAVMLVAALVLTLIIVHSTKVVDKDGKPTGNKLGFAADATTTTTTPKVGG